MGSAAVVVKYIHNVCMGSTMPVSPTEEKTVVQQSREMHIYVREINRGKLERESNKHHVSALQ